MTLLADLRAALSPGAVLAGDAVPAAAASDASRSGHALPRLLIRPRDTAEAAVALALCHRHGQTVVPQGGLTGLAGGACPRAGDVAISTARMSAVEAIDPEGLTITLGAGCVLARAQAAAEAQGLMFPVDIGARGSATVGGMIATNAGGIRVIRHGMMRENLLGLEAVLADGTVLSHMNTGPKDNTGYPLAQMLAGSEGTLALMTRAVIRLRPLPAGRYTALCALPDFAAVLALLRRARQELAGLSAFEVMWADYVAACQATEGVRLFAEVAPFTVILETDGPPEAAAALEAHLARALDDGVIADALIARSHADARRFWAVREGHGLDAALPGLMNLDVSLPVARIGAFAEAARAAVLGAEPAAQVMVFGHLGDGNIHIALALPDPDPARDHAAEALIYDTLRGFGGSVSAEHGIGTLKRDWLPYSRSPAELAAMRAIKAALDPLGLMNPGKVL